jgi:Rrf2 family protein
MKLSLASTYALHAVVHLAAPRSDSLVGSQDIARLLGITENRLVRILKSLVATRILWSLRGRGGGYRLARPASQVSVLEVIEAIDGPVRNRRAPARLDLRTDRGLDARRPRQDLDRRPARQRRLRSRRRSAASAPGRREADSAARGGRGAGAASQADGRTRWKPGAQR